MKPPRMNLAFLRRRPRASGALRWLELSLELAIVALSAMIAVQLPLPILDDWLTAKNLVIAFAAIGFGGKCLYDTLFYDRYWP
jgi:hypothetical protein